MLLGFILGADEWGIMVKNTTYHVCLHIFFFAADMKVVKMMRMTVAQFLIIQEKQVPRVVHNTKRQV